MLPIVALIGRTNVGKSTIFNILTKSRNALVANYPGLTRDRQYGICYLEESLKIILIDTAGVDINLHIIKQKIYKQTLASMEEADIILFVVDAREGLIPQEHEIAKKIRKNYKKTILLINKIDGINDLSIIDDFYALGFKHHHLISAAHNQGISDLIIDYLIPWSNDKNVILNVDSINTHYNLQQNSIKIAFIGKPNVGKSTLVNALLQKNRMITCDEPGTTLDSVSTPFKYNNKNYILIDTAGASKKRKKNNIIEHISMIKTLQTIEKTNVALLIIDAKISISSQDLSLSSFIIHAGKSIVIVINKWDLLNNTEKKTLKDIIKNKLKFLFFARIHFISALYQEGILTLFKSINEAHDIAKNKWNTSFLTSTMYIATQKHQPPIVKGRRIKLKYAHLGSSNPPNIIIHGNRVKMLSNSYKQYLINFFYKTLKIKGTPIKIEFKENLNPYIIDNPIKCKK